MTRWQRSLLRIRTRNIQGQRRAHLLSLPLTVLFAVGQALLDLVA